IEPAITANAAGDVLSWSNLDAPTTTLGPAQSITLVFQAAPQLDARDTPGLAVAHTNTSSATSEDSGGASGTAAGAYASGDDTAQATLQVPVLTVTKTPDGDPVGAGAASQFQIVIDNSGAGAARNVTVTDTLAGDDPATVPNIEGVTYSVGTATLAPPAALPNTFTEDASGYDPAAASSDVVWTIGEIGPGQTVSITVPVSVNTPQPDAAAIVNQVALAAAEFRPGDLTPAMSDVGSLTIGSAPDFALGSTKASTPADSGNPGDPTDVAPTDQIDYTIHYQNDGNANATGVVVIDPIPANTTYVTGSASATPADPVEFLVGGSWQSSEPADPADVAQVRWLVGAVNAPPESTDLTGDLGFSVSVARPLPDGTVISNTATLTSDQTPGGIALGPVAHEVVSAPALTLDKQPSADPLTVNDDGDLLTYTLAVTNTGDENATNVLITDGPPTGTSVVGYDAGGATVECSSDPPPGPYAFGACGADLSAVTQLRWTLPQATVDQTYEVDMTVRVPRPFANGTVLDNTAGLDTDQTAPSSSNTANVTVTTAPRVEVSKSVSPTGTVVPGQELTYRLSYVNSGSETATDVVLTDPVPTHATYVAGSATGSGALAGGAVRWAVGDLAVDQGGSVSFRVRVDSVVSVGSSVDNLATITADGIPPGSASTQSPVSSAPTIEVAKTALTRTASKGSAVKFRITATVGGDAPAEPLVLTDTLPKGLRFLSATGEPTHADGVVTWNFGTRQPGESVSVDLVARVLAASGAI
ncbi:MAG: hypothetical protein OEQ47_18770, partial [Acidimicrobiia bacterium]|nr:hypothetical protein [Acidimicrobiia bacterium]